MAGDGTISEPSRLKRFFVLAVVIICGMCLCLNVSAGTDTSFVSGGKVYVETMGKKVPVMISNTDDVESVLEKMEINLGELDEVTPALTTRLSDGDTISIKRREYVTAVEKGEIEYETVYYYSSETTPGKETVVVEGEDGQGERVFKRLLEDGKVVEETLIDENLTKKPVTKEISIGFRTKPTSGLDFDWEFDENGEPVDPKNVLRSQKATAYSAREGARTASGRPAQVGNVAVNPSVIPYGSKLFIQASDGHGKYIYGYAVAADTGSALNSGQCSVDLFFDSNAECYKFGVGTVDIFVLE